jgi:hypothetical protein
LDKDYLLAASPGRIAEGETRQQSPQQLAKSLSGGSFDIEYEVLLLLRTGLMRQ